MRRLSTQTILSSDLKKSFFNKCPVADLRCAIKVCEHSDFGRISSALENLILCFFTSLLMRSINSAAIPACHSFLVPCPVLPTLIPVTCLSYTSLRIEAFRHQQLVEAPVPCTYCVKKSILITNVFRASKAVFLVRCSGLRRKSSSPYALRGGQRESGSWAVGVIAKRLMGMGGCVLGIFCKL